ncbi:hypothetical protein DRQ26_02195 [bacterium]|nr:MAG: hypothetical protein DRQ26_02195 [bacterium]
MKKVLITGATGFVGSSVVSALFRKNYKVEIIARETSRLDHLPAEISVHRCSLLEPYKIAEKLADIDYFVHIAGLTKARRKEDFYKINGEAVKIWLDALLRYSTKLKKFVLISSQAAARPSDIPITEDDEPAPLTDYGKSKLLGEKYAREFFKKIPITIIRPPAVYGPRDRDIFFYFRLASKGILPLVGNPERKFSAIYVEDLACAIILAMEHPDAVGETFFATDGEIHTWRKFSDEVGNALAGKKIRIKLPAVALWLAAAADETISFMARKPALLSFQKVKELLAPWAADGTKIQKKLGFSPKFDLKTGIRKTALWYRENRWI